MKCVRCGADINGRFCPYCGSEMPADFTDRSFESVTDDSIIIMQGGKPVAKIISYNKSDIIDQLFNNEFDDSFVIIKGKKPVGKIIAYNGSSTNSNEIGNIRFNNDEIESQESQDDIRNNQNEREKFLDQWEKAEREQREQEAWKEIKRQLNEMKKQRYDELERRYKESLKKGKNN